MQDKWGHLLDVLKGILEIYQAILVLSQQKKQILVAAKPQELEKITKQEESLILQVGKLEGVRRKIVSEIMASHGITDEANSIIELQKIASSDVVEKLEDFQKEFGNIMAEMVPLNELNTELIKQALNFVNYNMNILSQTAVGPTYAPQGQSNEQGAKRRVFDAKV